MRSIAKYAFIIPMTKTISRRGCLQVLIILLSLVAGGHGQNSTVKDSSKDSSANYFLYVGTYTAKESKGIYAYRFDAKSGELTPMGLAAETKNPSFIAIDPTNRFLYAVNEVPDYNGARSGAVSAFSINRRTGKLTLLNQVASRGADPCYISVDKSGKYVLVANYTGGNVAVFPLQPDGRIGEATAFIQHTGSSVNKERQEAPHAHWIETTADNRFAVAVDLGLDELLVYHFGAKTGALAANSPPYAKLDAGAGPRHLAFDPNGKFAYVVNELQSSITAFAYDSTQGTFQKLKTVSTLPKDFSGKNDTAEIEVHPSGKFLFASNRGHDSIAVFSVDGRTGELISVGDYSTQGKVPRNFTIDPTGEFLFVANQDTNNIVSFRIDAASGKLTPTNQNVNVPEPVCLKFMRAE